MVIEHHHSNSKRNRSLLSSHEVEEFKPEGNNVPPPVDSARRNSYVPPPPHGIQLLPCAVAFLNSHPTYTNVKHSWPPCSRANFVLVSFQWCGDRLIFFEIHFSRSAKSEESEYGLNWTSTWSTWRRTVRLARSVISLLFYSTFNRIN